MLGVIALSAGDRGAAMRAARVLGLPWMETCQSASALPDGDVVLELADGLPQLRLTGRGRPGPVTVAFEDRSLAHRRRAGHNELLGRAIGWRAERYPRVLDATAGFGRDAFVLADLGCDVLLCERQAVMSFLLQDALQRSAQGGDEWLRSVTSRMRLHPDDARSLDSAGLSDRDVIYLDPMFRAERKAAPAKEMQLLQLVTGHSVSAGDGDADLLQWAIRQPVRRVVVKRPRRAPPLPGPPPGHNLSGRSVRFDVYPLAGGSGPALEE